MSVLFLNVDIGLLSFIRTEIRSKNKNNPRLNSKYVSAVKKKSILYRIG